MAYKLGVDLGTTCTAAVLLREHAAPEVVALGEHSATVPTVLHLAADSSVRYGEAAEAHALTEPGRIVRGFKRRLGDEIPLVIPDAEGHVAHHAHDLAAAMIAWVVAKAVAAEGTAPDAIAVTHPATWGRHKLELLRNALAAHDLENLGFVSEPEAAAHAYACAGRLRRGNTVAVYDIGGEAFDVTVLRAGSGGHFAVLGRPPGLPDLGGIDFDDAIFTHVLRAVSPAVRAGLGLGLGLDERTGELDAAAAQAVAKLRAACTAAKESLSTRTSATVPVITHGMTTEVRLTRAEFETLIVSSLLPTLSVLDHAIDAAAVPSGRIGCVLLAGGSTRIPLITAMLSAHLGPDVEIIRELDPKMAVAAGAVLAISADGARLKGAPPAPATVALPTGPGEPLQIPRGITSEAGKAAFARLAAAKAAREATAVSPVPRPCSGARSEHEVPTAAPAVPIVAPTKVPPVAPPPPAPAKDVSGFVQPKTRSTRAKIATVGPADAKPPAPKPTAPKPAGVPAAEAGPVAPVRAGEVGTGRPIRPHRGQNRTDVLGLDRTPGTAARRPPDAEGPPPLSRMVVPSRAVGGLADLLGADPAEGSSAEPAMACSLQRPAGTGTDRTAGAPGAKVAVETGPAPARPTIGRQDGHGGEFFSDIGLGQVGDEGPRPLRSRIPTVRQVLTVRRMLTVSTLTAAIFIGSGAWTAAIPAITDHVLMSSPQTPSSAGR